MKSELLTKLAGLYYKLGSLGYSMIGLEGRHKSCPSFCLERFVGIDGRFVCDFPPLFLTYNQGFLYTLVAYFMLLFKTIQLYVH